MAIFESMHQETRFHGRLEAWRTSGREDKVEQMSQDTGISTATLTDDERGERLAALQALIELMRPSVQSDGGDLVLLKADVESGVVEVQLQGACTSCAISSSTLEGGVERILKGRLDWVTEVIGGVDDADSSTSVQIGVGGWVPRADL
jgi:Fe-S cluster biogenesis protein NfuA